MVGNQVPNSSGVSIISHYKQSQNGRYKSLQGFYIPRNGGPYKGPAKKPLFRSKLELRLMRMLDNPNAANVAAWEYESRRIPYRDKSSVFYDNSGRPVFQQRNYVVDFVVKVKAGNGVVNTFWIEVKSVNDIEVNKRHRTTKNAKISEKIRLKNMCKWMAAAQAAKNSGARFMVVTEKELDSLAKMIFG